MALADCTADREFHPALKTIELYTRFRRDGKRFFDENGSGAQEHIRKKQTNARERCFRMRENEKGGAVPKEGSASVS